MRSRTGDRERLNSRVGDRDWLKLLLARRRELVRERPTLSCLAGSTYKQSIGASLAFSSTFPTKSRHQAHA
eukprot:scaffold1253_cov245-Pinguiococcus_pyrenoidosus.AAC.24